MRAATRRAGSTSIASQCQVGDAGCAPGSAAVITPIRDTRFAAETNNAFEIGEKATLLDRKLLFNVALFYQKYKDFQLNTFNGLVFVVDSIPQRDQQGRRYRLRLVRDAQG